MQSLLLGIQRSALISFSLYFPFFIFHSRDFYVVSIDYDIEGKAKAVEQVDIYSKT